MLKFKITIDLFNVYYLNVKCLLNNRWHNRPGRRSRPALVALTTRVQLPGHAGPSRNEAGPFEHLARPRGQLEARFAEQFKEEHRLGEQLLEHEHHGANAAEQDVPTRLSGEEEQTERKQQLF